MAVVNDVRDTIEIITEGLTPPRRAYLEISAVLQANWQVKTPRRTTNIVQRNAPRWGYYGLLLFLRTII
jgi:hypothetical protein